MIFLICFSLFAKEYKGFISKPLIRGLERQIERKSTRMIDNMKEITSRKIELGDNDDTFYLGKIRVEIKPTLSWSLPGKLAKFSFLVYPNLHFTRKEPKEYTRRK